jgi:hypothetical protein
MFNRLAAEMRKSLSPETLEELSPKKLLSSCGKALNTSEEKFSAYGEKSRIVRQKFRQELGGQR